MQELPGARRLVPAYRKDWNERLVWDGQPEKEPQPEREQTWQWHQVVQEVGRSVGYLHG